MGVVIDTDTEEARKAIMRLRRQRMEMREAAIMREKRRMFLYPALALFALATVAGVGVLYEISSPYVQEHIKEWWPIIALLGLGGITAIVVCHFGAISRLLKGLWPVLLLLVLGGIVVFVGLYWD